MRFCKVSLRCFVGSYWCAGSNGCRLSEWSFCENASVVVLLVKMFVLFSDCFRVVGRYCEAMKSLIIVLVLCGVVGAQGASLRIEGEQAWLKADGMSVLEVLYLFGERGVDVSVDPELNLGQVEGDWEDVRVERLIAQLVNPYSYSIEWRRADSSLGQLYRVSAIRVFGDNASAARPLARKARVLDIVEGAGGIKYVRGEILVGFEAGSTVEDLNALLAVLGGTLIEVRGTIGLYRIKLNDGVSVEDALVLAGKHPGVKAAEPNRAFSGEGNPSMSLSGSRAGMNLDLLPGENAIAVFDSGMDPKYEDLPLIRGTYNALDPSVAVNDPSGHGTLVSLIASGMITPEGAEPGASGVPVLAVQVFDENGMTSSDTLMRAIDYAIGSDVKIINLSFGTYEDVGFLENAVQYAASQGVSIFVAAGNDGLDVACNPAASPVTHSIGATDGDGQVADYSNREADAFYPGSVAFGGEQQQGTSFASPYGAYLYATRPLE